MGSEEGRSEIGSVERISQEMHAMVVGDEREYHLLILWRLMSRGAIGEVDASRICSCCVAEKLPLPFWRLTESIHTFLGCLTLIRSSSLVLPSSISHNVSTGIAHQRGKMGAWKVVSQHRYPLRSKA